MKQDLCVHTATSIYIISNMDACTHSFLVDKKITPELLVKSFMGRGLAAYANSLKYTVIVENGKDLQFQFLLPAQNGICHSHK
jgi:hypothetical protein